MFESPLIVLEACRTTSLYKHRTLDIRSTTNIRTLRSTLQEITSSELHSYLEDHWQRTPLCLSTNTTHHIDDIANGQPQIPRHPCAPDRFEEFISRLGDSIQQSSIENLCLRHLNDFPSSTLNTSKTIKSLTLNDCWAKESGPTMMMISLSTSPPIPASRNFPYSRR